VLRRRPAARALGACLLVGATTFSTVARAAPESASNSSLLLEWSGPGPELDCLGEEGLIRAVNEYLGRDAFESPAELVLHVNVDRLPDRHFHVVVEVHAPSGELLGTRELTSATDLCSSLNDRLVLTLALLADSGPEFEAEARPPEPARPSPEVPEPSDDEADETVRRNAKQPSTHVRFAAEASLGIEAGALPAVRPGLSIGLRMEPWPFVAVRVGGFAFWPASSEVGAASVRFTLFAGRLELCAGDFSPSHLQVGVCGGVIYAALGVTTHGVADGRDGTRAQWAGSLGLHGGLPLGDRWALIADVAAIFPNRPERFVVDLNSSSQQVFQMAKPSVLASFGGKVTF